MPNLQLLLEAERRGILPANKKLLLDEVRRRGLISDGGSTSQDDYYEQLYGSAQSVTAPEEKPLGGFWDSLVKSAQTLGLADEATAFATNPNEENRKALLAAGNSKFRGVGFGEGENWAAFKQLLGGSLGQMVAPVAAATAGSFATPIAGVAAGFGASAAQYQIQNLQRQAQEQERAIAEGRTPEELQLGKSLAASTVQAGLDVAQFKYFEKLIRAFPATRNLLLPEKEAVQQAADKLVDSYKAGTLKATPIGTVKDAAKGAAFEVPQEVAQTVLERWQAGLSLSDDEAQEEYKQAAIGAAILGPLMGGAAGYAGRAGERTAAQAEIERREEQAGIERSKQEFEAIRQGAAPPVPPAPPAIPGTQAAAQQDVANQVSVEADLRQAIEDEGNKPRFALQERGSAIGRSIRIQNLRQERPDLDAGIIDYLIEEGYTNKEILAYNKPARGKREPLSVKAYKAEKLTMPYEAAPASAPADVEVATEDLVATEAAPAPAPDVRTLALEAIKVKPTIKAISEATGLSYFEARDIMNGFADEGVVERKGKSKFKLVEPKAAETVEAKEEAAVETAPAEKTVKTTDPTKFVGLSDFNYTITESPNYNLEALSPEDADFELEVLQGQAERGRLTPQNFAQSEIGKRLDTAQILTVNAGLQTDPVGTIKTLRRSLGRVIPDTPATPTTETTSEPVSTRAGEAVAGATAGSPALPVQRGVPAGREAAESGVSGVEPVGGVAERVDEREGTVPPALEADTQQYGFDLVGGEARGVTRKKLTPAEVKVAKELGLEKEALAFSNAPNDPTTRKNLIDATRNKHRELVSRAVDLRKLEIDSRLKNRAKLLKDNFFRDVYGTLSDRQLNMAGLVDVENKLKRGEEIYGKREVRREVAPTQKLLIGESRSESDPELQEAIKRSKEREESRKREREETRKNREKRDIGLRFRRGEGKGLSASGVQATVSRIVKGWKNAPKINVVQSYTDLPGQHFPDTQGIYADGEIYLVADNLSDVAEVKATLFHESLGHFGLEQVFGKRLKEVMLNLYRTNKAVQKQADQYLAMFPDTYAGETREDQIALAVEEVLAEASAAGPKVKDASALRAAFNRVANLIRKFLNAMGFPVTYTNNEINEILIQAHGAVVAGQRKERIGDGTIKYQRKQAEEKLSKVFDYNLTASTYNSKVGDGVRGAYGNMSDKLREASLGMLAIKDQAEIWKKELPSVEELDVITSSRGATELSRREEVGEYVKKFYNTSKKHSTEVMNRFFAVANMTTVYQVDPLNPADLAVLNKPVNKMDGQDRAAYDILKEFEALPKDLQKSYKELREFYEDKSKQLFDLLAARLGTDVVSKLKAKYDEKRLRVYLPLYRRGDYWLTYTDKNNETITSAFNSDIDRTRGRDAAAADGGKDFERFSRLTEARRKGPLPTGFLGEIVTTLQEQGAPEDMIDSVYETFLNYLPAESIRQQFQSRESSYDPATGTTRYGEFGFEPDVFQAFANVATRMANQLTNLEYAIPIENVMSEIYKQSGGAKPTNSVLAAVHNNLTKQVDFIRNPQSNWAVDGASYFSYMWFIAGNISSALVNTTQLALVVAPMLGGKYGYNKSTSAINKAFKTYFNGGFDTNSDFSFGAAANLDPKYKKLYDTAVSRSVIRRSTSYDITELQKTSTKDYVGTKSKVMKWLGWTFQNSERFNREITLLAAFDLAYARTGNVDTAINEAMKLTNDSHGVALTETGPRLFQQGFGKVMFTFKRFAQAQIYLLSKLFNQAFKDSDRTTREVARSQLVGIFGSSYLLAGVQGMPLYGAIELLATLTDMAIGDDDEPFDATAYVDSALTDTGRKGLLNKLINLDIAARTGFNGMLWREDYKRVGDIGPVLYTLELAMGPAYAAAMGVGRSIALASEGEYHRAVEAIAPSYIRNVWKTLRYAEEGVRNKDGTPVVEDVSDYNLMMQAVGFAPSEVSYARERASSTAKLQDKLVKRRSSLLDKYYAAWQEQDAKGIDEALDNIIKFNAKNPQQGLAITQNTIRKSITGRVTRQEQSVDGLYLPMSVRNRIAQILPGD
jgi:hypothetical protein